MAKSKKNRVTVARRPRLPNGQSRIDITVPNSTGERIAEHCKRNGVHPNDFLKKAIYDALPVHYEVTEEWTFPFGKYAGETAGTVKQLDPGYIVWCKKTIVGFHDKMNVDDVANEADVRAEGIGTAALTGQVLTPSQCYHLMRGNEKEAVTKYKFWGKDRYTGSCHLIAVRENMHCPWIKVTTRG